jgi:ADP-ribose pyrophosphatase
MADGRYIFEIEQAGADLPTQRAKVLKSEILYQGKVFRLQRDTVIEPGGVEAERDIVVHPGSVVVLPVFKDGRVLLIRQYRHSVGEFLWELVAGRKEPQESPIAGARRELLEETGYTAKRLRKLLRVVPTPGFANEWMWIFAAEGLTAGAAQPEEDEKITPRIFTLKQVEKMIQRGTLRDAKSICGLLYYMRFLKRRR